MKYTLQKNNIIYIMARKNRTNYQAISTQVFGWHVENALLEKQSGNGSLVCAIFSNFNIETLRYTIYHF